MLNGSAICKDCGNGTMNNRINTRFGLADGLENESEVAVCLSCGSTHIDGMLYEELDEEVEEDEISDVLNSDPFSDEPFEREVGA
jgi:ribosomal protein L32